MIADGGWIELHLNHNNARQKYVIDRYTAPHPLEAKQEWTFDASASYDPLTYLWDFGDKSASTRMLPLTGHGTKSRA